jgi:polyisoprenoid-binding protein YceI
MMSTTTLDSPTAPDTVRHTWHVDTQHVEAGFAVRHLMISSVKGHFRTVSGIVKTVGEDFSTAEVDLTIDAKSIETRDEGRDAHLKSPDFFDVEKFPSLTFKSTKVTSIAKNQFTVSGNLTIRDVTRPVTLDVVSEGFVRDPWGNEKAGFSAKGILNRKDFGLTWNVALETGGVLVGDDVKLNLEIELTRQKAE